MATLRFRYIYIYTLEVYLTICNSHAVFTYYDLILNIHFIMNIYCNIGNNNGKKLE